MTETIKYKILMFVRYLGDSFFYPFFALYLSYRGIIEGKIGFILSISPLIGILCNPIFSKICKNIRITKNVLMIITLMEAVMITCISFSSNFTLITLFTIFMAIFGACHYGLMDSLTVVYADKCKINFSSLRIFGSIAYIIGTMSGGYIIDLFGYQICFMLCSLMFIISGIMYFIIMPMDIENKESEKPNIKEVLTSKKYLLFVCVYVFIVGTCMTGDNFLSVYLESRGIGSDLYGLVYAYIVFIEVVMLILLNKFSKKLNMNILLITAASLMLIRYVVNGLYLPILLVLVVAGLRGVTYSILLHIAFEHVLKLVGTKNSTFGVMFMILCYSIFIFIFNNVNGQLIQLSTSYKPFYLLMISFSGLAVGMSILYYFLCKKNKLVKG